MEQLQRSGYYLHRANSLTEKDLCKYDAYTSTIWTNESIAIEILNIIYLAVFSLFFIIIIIIGKAQRIASKV